MKKLENPSKWPILGCNDDAVWGHCQGSGQKPYEVMVDLGGPAFKCSCPSRKFPCKHGLGLLTLYATRTDMFANDPPDWLSDWLASRAGRAEKRAERQQQKAEQPADPEARAKRQAKRRQTMSAGLQDLELWLRDLLRNGLGAARTQPQNYWAQAAKRLVDAQAPGAAGFVRALESAVMSGSDWAVEALHIIGRLHLLIAAFTRFDTLSEARQADVRTALGWAMDKDDVLAEPGVQDEYRVLGLSLEENENLREQRVWLRGRETGRDALILNFAAGGQPLDVSFVPGAGLTAELAYYPGAWPLRVLVKGRQGNLQPTARPTGYATIDAALAAAAAAAAQNPWLGRLPMLLEQVVPHRDGDGWALMDRQQQMLAVTASPEELWQLYAVSGGNPVSVFGEWYGHRLTMLSAFVGDEFLCLSGRAG